MSTMKEIIVSGSIALIGIAGNSFADDDATTLVEMFTKGATDGTLKSYYFAQTFDDVDKNDSGIWVNGGHLRYRTGKFYGLRLGGKFQASFVGYKNDDSGVTAGSMDADGAVLSEAYLQYDLYQTRFKGGRQHINLPLIANSGSRMIKESFEGYFLNNSDIPGTTISLGWVNKYQTRTDKSHYADNPFVDYEQNGSGRPGDFYDIGDNGVVSLYLKNTSLENLAIQANYTDVLDELTGFYGDIEYTFTDVTTTPRVGVQYFYTTYDEPEQDNNYLVGLMAGLQVSVVDFFAAYTTVGGSAGDARVYRGLGQGAYYQYTDTTKTAGEAAFEANTDSYQIGAGYNYEDSFTSKLRFTTFDNPTDNADLDEYTLNLRYKFEGAFEGFSVSIDFSVLDYENDQKDATDLRSRLIYTF